MVILSQPPFSPSNPTLCLSFSFLSHCFLGASQFHPSPCAFLFHQFLPSSHFASLPFLIVINFSEHFGAGSISDRSLWHRAMVAAMNVSGVKGQRERRGGGFILCQEEAFKGKTSGFWTVEAVARLFR